MQPFFQDEIIKSERFFKKKKHCDFSLTDEAFNERILWISYGL